MDINEMKRDLLEYDLYYLLDGAQYGDYLLTIINENGKVIIIVHDNQGSAAGTMTKEDFLNISTNKDLEKYINSVLYYNYVEEV